MSNDERRKKRSEWASEALRMQLRYATEQFGVERMVLTDKRGHVWAATDVHVESVALARALPRLVEADEEHEETQAAVKRGVRMCQLEVGETQLLLAAEGDEALDALAASYRGVERILGNLYDAVVA